MTGPWCLIAPLINLLLLTGNVQGASRSSAQSGSTCASRTVNYITHSLPQQCHKSSWSSPPATAINGTDSASHDVESIITATDDTVNTIEAVTPASTVTTTSQSSEVVPSSSETPASSQATPSSLAVPEESESDADSALGNSNFLSFEDWKKQNLAKKGQSVEHVGKKQPASDENRKRPSNIHNALDSLGDDAEIDLNFGSFSAERPESPDPLPWGKATEIGQAVQEEDEIAPRAKTRNKDAGTTCKERFNYASFDCAAAVRNTNPQASGAVSVLIEKNKDSYMLNECSAENKFIILELCDDIAIDTVVLANFEFFSSTFRTFRVSVSDRYPVKLDKWKVLGEYEARNSREIQAFLVENPLIWARYLRIEFLTHYGNEFYCPLSLIRVHGKTMIEDYKNDEMSSRADEEEGQEESSLENDASERTSPDAIATPILEEQAAKSSTVETELLEQIAAPTITTYVNVTEAASTELALETSPYNHLRDNDTWALFRLTESTCSISESPGVTMSPISSVFTTTSEFLITSTVAAQEATSPETLSTAASTSIKLEEPVRAGNEASHEVSTANATTPSLTTFPTKPSQPDNARTISTSTQPHAANPTIQESFFKSVQKRLQMLESNSSLSLQYIEEQSRILREAFSKVEQKQLAKTTTFLDYLNSTVLNELRDFRQQYDQIWQSTVIELETQREQYQREVLAMNTRLGILADEVIFQKRMSILQSILVLLCLGLVLFSRGALNSYLELPILQNVITRSQSFRFPNGADTPNGSPISPSLSSGKSRYRRHQRDSSGDTTQEDPAIAPEIAYSPPTPPTSHYDIEGDDLEMAGQSDESNEMERRGIQRPRSSPGVLTTSVEELATAIDGHAEGPVQVEEAVEEKP